MRKVIIYTDGSCYPNPGNGGWAVILMDVKTGRERVLQGGLPATTISVMELTAAVEALEALKVNCEVEFYTDSQYVQKGITEWIANWKHRQWPKKIKHQELWKRLDTARMDHNVNWMWVPGHTLLLDAFVGKRPNGMETRHLDGNPKNNCLSNLEYGTVQQNANDRIKHGRNRKGSNHPRAKLTEDIVVKAKKQYSDGKSIASLARLYKVSESSMRNALWGITWSHVNDCGV